MQTLLQLWHHLTDFACLHVVPKTQCLCTSVVNDSIFFSPMFCNFSPTPPPPLSTSNFELSSKPLIQLL